MEPGQAVAEGIEATGLRGLPRFTTAPDDEYVAAADERTLRRLRRLEVGYRLSPRGEAYLAGRR